MFSIAGAANVKGNRVNANHRFAFGKNWQSFARRVDEDRLMEAEASLRNLFDVTSLKGRRFLDIGCGSGLFTVAASRLGAQVTAFDFDPDSVATTRALVQRLSSAVEGVTQGDVLDRTLLTELDRFDVVYSWGVLHHTGNMWQAIENAAEFTRPGGVLAIAIYNDQGRVSRIWRRVKQTYVRLPWALRPALILAIVLPYETSLLLQDLARRRPQDFVRRWSRYRHKRGMSRLHDHIDWIGGYPFEVARPQDIVDFLQARGFRHRKTLPASGRANNQFVFSRLE